MKTLITPEIASELLKANTINRRIKESVVGYLAGEMKNGNFVYNGESIIVSDTGRLLDGQHRLLAIKYSGVSVYVNLVVGV